LSFGFPPRPRASDASNTSCAMLAADMREPEVIEAELMEISGIAEDETKFERIVAWCATHPDEIPFAMKLLMGR
jgi:hypothetical protein